MRKIQYKHINCAFGKMKLPMPVVIASRIGKHMWPVRIWNRSVNGQFFNDELI